MRSSPGQISLDLEVEKGEFPPDFFVKPANGEEDYQEGEKDRQYPIEKIPIHGGEIVLREIRGVWLWGYSITTPGRGGGMYPFRKWGPKFATMSREASITSARLYIVNEYPEVDHAR